MINVSSMGHRSGRIHFDDPSLSGRYSGLQAHCQSKLVDVLFTQELARQTRGSGLVTHALHPGVIRTNLLQETGFANQPTVSPAQGAQTSVFLATDPAAGQHSGGYYALSKPQRPATADPALRERLWELSAAQCGLTPGRPR